MPNLGFDVRDYSTQAKLGSPPSDEVLVLVPKRDTGLPPLVERPYSSLRLRERRLFFDAIRSPSGFVVLTDVPAGSYAVHLRSAHYVPFDGAVASTLFAPLRVDLHRDASYPFVASDTLIRGKVVRATGVPLTGFDVRLSDPSPSVPHHRVPLNAKGEFVVFVPEKRAGSPVTLAVFHPGGTLNVTVPLVVLNRTTVVPLITVP